MGLFIGASGSVSGVRLGTIRHACRQGISNEIDNQNSPRRNTYVTLLEALHYQRYW